jgi:hypothetical protein
MGFPSHAVQIVNADPEFTPHALRVAASPILIIDKDHTHHRFYPTDVANLAIDRLRNNRSIVKVMVHVKPTGEVRAKHFSEIHRLLHDAYHSGKYLTGTAASNYMCVVMDQLVDNVGDFIVARRFERFIELTLVNLAKCNSCTTLLSLHHRDRSPLSFEQYARKFYENLLDMMKQSIKGD